MTPEQMTAALGAGWERRADDEASERWERIDSGVTVFYVNDDWSVSIQTDAIFDDLAVIACPAEAVVATALLLLAAEEVAGGARVGSQGRWVDRFEVAPGYLRLRAPCDLWSAAAARSLALDLLRAAREAETQA